MTRRETLVLPAISAMAQQTAGPDWIQAVVDLSDKEVDRVLRNQNTDPASRWRGLFTNEVGIHSPFSGGVILEALTPAFLQPRSKHFQSNTLPERIRLAVEAMARHQTPDGTWHLPTRNFNSPPDTGFIIRDLASAAVLLKRSGKMDLFGAMEPVLRKAGSGLTKGGVHTPNHRWVICAALARLYELFGDDSYVRRIDQWLAEGVDIDPDGQYSERSTGVYNPTIDDAFVTMSAKLKRPELLEPVRKNLNSMLYLLHPGYEVVTEISRRQDRGTRRDIGRYWFALAYMARQDQNGQFATLARHFAASRAPLATLMEYPELADQPAGAPVPEDYTKFYPHNQLVHVRKGPISALILGADRPGFFGFRHGEAVVNAVHFASAFFGKGHFASAKVEERSGSYLLTQSLEGAYYQPLDPPRKVGADEWEGVRQGRSTSGATTLMQSVTITRTEKGFRLRLRSVGQVDVPLWVEISFREGGELEGVVPVGRIPNAYALKTGACVYRMGTHGIRVSPGTSAHNGVSNWEGGPNVKLPGPSVYLTGFTPFDHTLEFEAV